MKHTTSRQKKPVISIMIGLANALLVTLILGVLNAYLLNKNILSEETTIMSVMLIHFLASLFGSLIAVKCTQRKFAIISSCVSFAYCLVLITITLFCFGGQFDGIWSGITSCTVGAIGACSLCLIKGKRKMKIAK